MGSRIINIGILAHVDAGKTTLTESMLYLSGAIKEPGDVDKGTAHTDFLDIEKDRGISIRSAASTFFWKNTQINLIDTPGHIDFSSEVERSLRVLDAAILVISSVEGVQAHTENIWQALKTHQIPTIIFINKIDRLGADPEAVIEDIKGELCENLAILQKCTEYGDSNVRINSLLEGEQINEELIECIASTNDILLEQYLEGIKIDLSRINKSLQDAVKDFKLIPLHMGVAKSQLGVTELLDSIISYFPFAANNAQDEVSALIYRIDHIEGKGKVAGIRMYSGTLNNRDTIKITKQNKIVKINQIWQYKGNSLNSTGKVSAGDIAAVSGLNQANIGDVLGNEDLIPTEVEMFSPLLTLQVRTKNEKDYAKLAEALQILSSEDPALNFEWLRDEKELHVKIMGWIQIEILERTLEQRFGILASFDKPIVIYKETPINIAEGFARYWMPKPCWAIIKLLIEPGAHGSGVVYESKVRTDDVHRKYQNEVARSIQNALRQGPKGWEVTDIKITFIEGEDHEVHSHPGDFVVATPMAIMNGLVESGTCFLEPYHHFKIKAPKELLGAITSDIIKMRGSFENPEIKNDKFTIQGEIPVSTSLDFPVKLSSRSGGKAKISTSFAAYRKCTEDLGIVRDYKGISPLDEAKYILKARKALQESFK